MCGQGGHFEPRCPNKICLKVASFTSYGSDFVNFIRTSFCFAKNSAVNEQELINLDAKNVNRMRKCNVSFVV